MIFEPWKKFGWDLPNATSMCNQGILAIIVPSKCITFIAMPLELDGKTPRTCMNYEVVRNKRSLQLVCRTDEPQTFPHRLSDFALFSNTNLKDAHLQTSLDKTTSEVPTDNIPFEVFRLNPLLYVEAALLRFF